MQKTVFKISPPLFSILACYRILKTALAFFFCIRKCSFLTELNIIIHTKSKEFTQTGLEYKQCTWKLNAHSKRNRNRALCCKTPLHITLQFDINNKIILKFVFFRTTNYMGNTKSKNVRWMHYNTYIALWKLITYYFCNCNYNI